MDLEPAMDAVPDRSTRSRRALSARLAPLLALLLGIGPSGPQAAGLADAAARVEAGGSAGRDALVVQVDYLVPEYKGGDKFRSPAAIDTALAEDLARRLRLSLRTIAPGREKAGDLAGEVPAGGREVLRLTTLRDAAAVPEGMAVVPVDYRAAPMAIMRSDTTIKRWEQLQGRKVCVAAGGNHVGTIATRYGAQEQVHPSPTDALVALRIGGCDAMVHDSAMLEELIRFPEWKKFSARLRGSQRSTLAFLVPAQDEATVSTLRRVAWEWDARSYPEALVKKTVRDIAFEVYLEQEVPDCH